MPADLLARLTTRIDRTASALELNGQDGARLLQVAGPDLQREAEAAARTALGPDLVTFPGVGGRAGVRLDGQPTSYGYSIRLQLTPAITFIVGQVGTEPHLIAPRAGTRGRQRVVGGRGFKHPVSHAVKHPGTQGQNAIRYVYKRVRDAQGAAVDAGINRVLQEAWSRG